MHGGASKEDVTVRHPLCGVLTMEVYCVRVDMRFLCLYTPAVFVCWTLSDVRWRAI